ncbi:MAG TPA: hypothetical protein VM103_01995 [Candidatus Paceibacterota bacterium]|nr:hypothetical protein [Candidatus Paceibacterota bacterium]
MTLTMVSYYEQIVSVTTDYLGPASKRFIDRQISFHFNNKDHETLTKDDVAKLADSVRISLGLLTQDAKMVTEAEARIRAIATA